MLERMIDNRPEADRLLVARLTGTAKHHAGWRELTADEDAAAVTALRGLAAGRADLLAEVTGILEGFAEGEGSKAETGQVLAERLVRDVLRAPPGRLNRRSEPFVRRGQDADRQRHPLRSSWPAHPAPPLASLLAGFPASWPADRTASDCACTIAYVTADIYAAGNDIFHDGRSAVISACGNAGILACQAAGGQVFDGRGSYPLKRSPGLACPLPSHQAPSLSAASSLTTASYSARSAGTVP